MLFSVYDEQGDLIASNTYFSVGGGFVVNKETQFSRENMYYKQIDKKEASATRLEPFHPVQDPSQPLLSQKSDHNIDRDSASKADLTNSDEGGCQNNQPPLPFHSGDSLLELTRQHNVTTDSVLLF